MKSTIGLWRFNSVTGYWILARDCHVINASRWLYIYQIDEPGVKFRLSFKRPR